MTINSTFNVSACTARLCNQPPIRFGSQADIDAFKQRNPSLTLPNEQNALLENLIGDDYGPMHTDMEKMQELTGYTAEVIKFLASNFTDAGIRMAVFVHPFMQVHDRVLDLIQSLREKQAQLTEEDSRKLLACLVRSRLLIEKLLKSLAPAKAQAVSAESGAQPDSASKPANENLSPAPAPANAA